EFVGQFWAGSSYKKTPSKKTVRKYLQSNYCKKIMAWSEWSKKGVLKEFPELEKKIEIVYPAVPFVRGNRKKTNKKIQILFVGRDFEVKGGKIAWKVMDTLTKKYDNVEGIIISNVLNKKFEKNKRIKIYNLVSQKKLFEEIYPQADIFLYPTFSDTFGFAILEAQSFGLPVVAMKTGSTHTIEETIQEGKTGFIINNSGANAHKRVFKGKVFNEIMLKTEKLVKNGRLRKEMSRNCFKEIENGKFSIKERNKKLERIYSEALE
ncbi:glycosyltransferase family 4 protein, partial [Candidatus Pacearchaeota archaeon]|nr:glycosyltransferase family 4 protein [Candidatus Pacearchaeota archaeon]